MEQCTFRCRVYDSRVGYGQFKFIIHRIEEIRRGNFVHDKNKSKMYTSLTSGLSN